jgi:hypothetical protein
MTRLGGPTMPANGRQVLMQFASLMQGSYETLSIAYTVCVTTDTPRWMGHATWPIGVLPLSEAKVQFHNLNPYRNLYSSQSTARLEICQWTLPLCLLNMPFDACSINRRSRIERVLRPRYLWGIRDTKLGNWTLNWEVPDEIDEPAKSKRGYRSQYMPVIDSPSSSLPGIVK